MKTLTRTGALVLGLLVALIVLAPLPEGSAYPWALAVTEATVFALVAVWLLMTALGRSEPTLFSRSRSFALPAVLFVTVICLQLAPMPPAALRTISPATYSLYELSLPGWPHTRRYNRSPAHTGKTPGTEAGRGSILPTINGAAAGTKVPFTPVPKNDRRLTLDLAGAGLWRSISIAPSMTGGALLEVAVYVALFFLVLLYPFGPAETKTEETISRTIVMAAVLSGLIVAVVGIVEFFTWNGKILWLLVPYDWGAPQPGALSRAMGPFVNPDHFGDYLALVLPLAVGGALFRSDLFLRSREFRVFSAVTAFLIVCALLLSLSRGAWIASAIALAVLIALSARLPQGARPHILGPKRGTTVRRAGVLAFTLIALCLLFIGPQGRQQIDLRLQQTLYSDSGLGGRLQLASDTLGMVRDHPVFGVGLACWPELFPHYRRPPWTATFYRETHNDYAQLLAETGIIGFALVAWFFVAVASRIYRRFAVEQGPVSPVFAAVCAALVVIAFHEFFDFSLHTPANALLFTVLLALAVRMADGPAQYMSPSPHSLRMRVASGLVSVFAILLSVLAFKLEKIPYPHDIKTPASAVDAAALISAHPAESAPHVDLVQLGGARLSPEQHLAELRAAVWLDPTNPYARDVYAHALARRGMEVRALANVKRSVEDSPSLSTHFYLSDRLIPWLSASEERAVERGFNEAIKRRYDGAVRGLANFYQALGRFADAGNTYRRAAQAESDSGLREEYLVGAGIAYARAGDLATARKVLESAVRNDPTDTRAYQYLTRMVLSPRHELKAAQQLVAQGVQAGADAPQLYQALASAAQSGGDEHIAETALRDAVGAQPTFDSLMRLGMFYLNEGKYDHAAFSLSRATELKSGSANAYFYLGVAEERGYHFSQADKDLSRAVQLAPSNADYRAHYLSFQRKVAGGISASRSLNQ